MTSHSRVRILILLVLVGAVNLRARADCTPPPALQARLRAHPEVQIEVQTYVDLGNWFGDKKQYECAIQAFSNALQLDPASPRLQYLFGLSLYTGGHADQAIDPLRQSVKTAPDGLQPHLLLAAALAQAQRNDEAKAEWQAALKIDPHSSVALDGLSKVLIAEEDYSAVIALLRSIPRDQNLALDLAQAYGKGRMFDDAAKTLRQALQAHPSSWPLTKALTTVLVNQAHHQEALKLTAAYAQLHPRDIEAQKLYLRILLVNNDNQRARPLASRLLAASRHDFDLLYLNGVLEVEGGQFTAAREHLTEAVSLDPAYYNARYNLGRALLELKDYAGAREQLQKAIELGATEPEIRFKYANALQGAGETQLAQEQLKIYQEQMQGLTNRTLAASKAAQAEKELEKGDAQKAVTLYREAVGATPNDALLNFKLGLALDRAGDTVAELAALEKAIQIDPDMAIAHNQLGYLASHSGDVAAAEEHFRQAVRAAPGYKDAWVSLAATLGMESRFPEAQEAVGNALKLDPKSAEALHLQTELTAAQGKVKR